MNLCDPAGSSAARQLTSLAGHVALSIRGFEVAKAPCVRRIKLREEREGAGILDMTAFADGIHAELLRSKPSILSASRRFVFRRTAGYGAVVEKR